MILAFFLQFSYLLQKIKNYTHIIKAIIKLKFYIQSMQIKKYNI